MFKSYLVMAVKVFLRRKFFTFASLFGICFTLVVLMVATAVLDHMLMPHMPDVNNDRTLLISSMSLIGEGTRSTSSPGYRFLDENVRDLPKVERVSIFTAASPIKLYRDAESLELYVSRTDGQFWKILQFDFLEGGPFSDEDERDGNRVAVISRRTRQRLFAGAAALGKTIDVNRRRFEVVGVVADVSYLRTGFSDIWVPISTSQSQAYRDDFMSGFNGLLLAETAADRRSIQEELTSRLPDIERPQPERYDQLVVNANTHFEQFSTDIVSGENNEPFPGRVRAILILAALLFMLLPSLNLVNLNLSRIFERSSEIGVRRAFGARSGSLLVQFLTENVLLTLFGGLLGLLISRWLLKLINNAELVPFVDFQLNWRIFAWGMLLALIFGVLSGVYPAWKMSRLHPAEALRARSKL